MNALIDVKLTHLECRVLEALVRESPHKFHRSGEARHGYQLADMLRGKQLELERLDYLERELLGSEIRRKEGL